jgi:hypothetical protein
MVLTSNPMVVWSNHVAVRRFADLLAAVPDDRRAVVIEGIGHLADAACSARHEVFS